MAFDYINEAFKRLDVLEEDIFKTSTDGISALTDFIENDDDEVVNIIDPEATTEEEINDSYVGKVIVNCNVCHSHIFENKDEIVIDEDGAVNVEETCPYCGESEGFTIIGEIAPFNAATSETSQNNSSETTSSAPVEEPVDADEELEELFDVKLDARGFGGTGNNVHVGPGSMPLVSSLETKTMSKATSRALQGTLEEDFKEVSIKTEDQKLEMTSDENGKVTVTTEPIQAEVAEETIVPVSDETTDDILANNEVEPSAEELDAEMSFEETEEPAVEEEAPIFEESLEDEHDIEFDDVDEDGFNNLAESYLKNVYENVESFKTTDISCTPTQMIVEGVISFQSGVSKKTGFIFEAHDINSRGQVRFIGTNKQLTESQKAFTLVGSVDNKKLFTESLKYQYSVNEQPVRGVVRRK